MNEIVTLVVQEQLLEVEEAIRGETGSASADKRTRAAILAVETNELRFAPAELKWELLTRCIELRRSLAGLARASASAGGIPDVDEAPDRAPESARALSNGVLRRTDDAVRLCEGCGAVLEGGRRQRRCCNGRCRAAASRERKRRELAQVAELICVH